MIGRCWCIKAECRFVIRFLKTIVFQYSFKPLVGEHIAFQTLAEGSVDQCNFVLAAQTNDGSTKLVIHLLRLTGTLGVKDFRYILPAVLWNMLCLWDVIRSRPLHNSPAIGCQIRLISLIFPAIYVLWLMEFAVHNKIQKILNGWTDMLRKYAIKEHQIAPWLKIFRPKGWFSPILFVF